MDRSGTAPAFAGCNEGQAIVANSGESNGWLGRWGT